MLASPHSSRRWSLIFIGAVLLPTLFSLESLALSVSDVSPLVFDGVGGFGTSAATAAAQGESPLYSAVASDQWIQAGSANNLPVTIQQNLGIVHQNPAAPNAANPIIADSIWRIENQSAGNLIAPLLVFTAVDPSENYPAAVPLIGLDGKLVDLLSYSTGGVDYLFGVLALPSLAVGEFVDVTVRYIAQGSLAGEGDGLLPALGVSVLGSYAFVPEPGTALLLGAGLAVLAGAARRRS